MRTPLVFFLFLTLFVIVKIQRIQYKTSIKADTSMTKNDNNKKVEVRKLKNDPKLH